MDPVRRAVVDVGTNSVKLLVADVAGPEVRAVCEQSKQTRLGHGFYDTRILQPEAIAATAAAVAAFATQAREAQAASVRVVATSAAREALNREELTAAIARAAGLEVEVLSGEQEAEWGFRGVTTDPQFAHTNLLLMDVGGGSAQFTLGRKGCNPIRYSFPLGAVRLLEKFPCSDPPKASELAACRQWLKAFLEQEVRPKLLPGMGGLNADSTDAVPLVGVGGAATILACMEARLETFDRARIEAARLSAARVLWHLERLWRLPLEQRKETVGLPKNRADIILTGVAIYQAVMEDFGFPELRVSTRGLRFAAVMS
jgi:exopolyphosphatase/guanosine-5'-triphosphate,3'-diphosphate pyrophosphatase